MSPRLVTGDLKVGGCWGTEVSEVSEVSQVFEVFEVFDSVTVCRAIFGQAGLKISCDLTGWSLMQPDIITRPSHLRPGYQATIFQILVFIFNENLHSHGNCTQYIGSVQVESWITEYIIKMPSRHISLESSSIACVSPARTFLNILPASASSFYFYSGGKLKQN